MIRNRICTLLLLAVSCLQFGCGLSNTNQVHNASGEPVSAIFTPSKKTVDPGSDQMQRRFETTGERSLDPVQSVLMWSEKYEELSIKNNLLREKSSEIRDENSALKKRIETLETELEKSKKELAEANAFLQKMHLELNEWKNDVLGFRDEMRNADKVQLAALAKILRVLGAEPMAESQNEEDSIAPEE